MKVVRFGLTVCLFAVTSFSAAETSLEVWPAAAQEGPIFVWFKDGSTLEAVGPVKQDDQMLVFRLANSTLVSVNVGNKMLILDSPTPGHLDQGRMHSDAVSVRELVQSHIDGSFDRIDSV